MVFDNDRDPLLGHLFSAWVFNLRPSQPFSSALSSQALRILKFSRVCWRAFATITVLPCPRDVPFRELWTRERWHSRPGKTVSRRQTVKKPEVSHWSSAWASGQPLTDRDPLGSPSCRQGYSIRRLPYLYTYGPWKNTFCCSGAHGSQSTAAAARCSVQLKYHHWHSSRQSARARPRRRQTRYSTSLCPGDIRAATVRLPFPTFHPHGGLSQSQDMVGRESRYFHGLQEANIGQLPIRQLALDGRNVIGFLVFRITMSSPRQSPTISCGPRTDYLPKTYLPPHPPFSVAASLMTKPRMVIEIQYCPLQVQPPCSAKTHQVQRNLAARILLLYKNCKSAKCKANWPDLQL